MLRPYSLVAHLSPYIDMEDSGPYPMYSCKNCRNPLGFHSDLISKDFKAKSGQAYLFNSVMNVAYGQKQEKQLMTGMYRIADIYCGNCGEKLGWKYLQAYDRTQKLKEGRFILEKLKIIKEY